LTEDRKARMQLGSKARRLAQARLNDLYSTDLAAFEKEERVKLGLPAEKAKSWQSVASMRKEIQDLREQLSTHGITGVKAFS
jgi:hypothetical protein